MKTKRKRTYTVHKAFVQHRIGARGRGIPFNLTYEAWLKIWTDSGHLHERGRTGSSYVMGRIGDKGAYEIGNVIIITQSQNLSDGHRGLKHTKEAKAKMSEALRQRPPNPEAFKKISESLKGRVKSEEHRRKLSIGTKRSQAKMRAEGRHVGRPKNKKANCG